MGDSDLFMVKVKYVGRKQIIQPQDHNSCVDAFKELVIVAKRITERFSIVIR